MSARQNKKRKGRNNVNNRERTVTTFTEDPNTSFLVPLSSEDPPGGPSTNVLSSPFSIASSSGQQNSFNQLAQTFSMPYANYIPTQQQQQFYQPFLPPGKNDLEILENLKNIIKEGQHEFYRAVPQPAALASLYTGPIPHAQSQVPPHPEQLPHEYDSPRFAHDSVTDTRNFNLATGKSSLETVSQSMNNVAEMSSLPVDDTSTNTLSTDGHAAADIKPSPGQLDSEDKSQITSQGHAADMKTDQTGEYGTSQVTDSTSPNKTASFNTAKDDLPRESGWNRRTLDDRKGQYDDRNGNLPRTGAYDNRLLNGNGTGPDSRPPPAEDRRFYDRDRSRDRFLDRDRDRDRDWDRDRSEPTRDFRDFRERDRDRDVRDRRPDFFGRSYGRTHAPRPPPELRHYEPSYGADYVPPRRHDVDDRRGGPRTGPHDDRVRPPPYDDRRPPYDDRRPPSPPAAADDRRLSMDDRPMRPLPGSDNRALPPSSEDRARPSAEPVLVPRPTANDDRATHTTSLPADERPRTNVSLEERLSQPATATPSLQDRLSQPGPTARADVSRAPSLEERLSLAPVTTPAVPVPVAVSSTAPARPFARSASLSRDELRAPPPKDDVRDHDRVSDFRTTRDFSRERPGGPPFTASSSYRPDPDRSFGDRDDRDRRDRDVIDGSLPPRFGDSFGRFGLPPRRLSPPPIFDRDRDRERGRSYLPPRSPPLFRAGDSTYDPESDRRSATDRERDTYEQRRRDWYGPGGDDDKRGSLPPPPPASWRPYDRGPSFVDRERFDRDRDFRERERDRESIRDRDRDRDFGGLLPIRHHWDERDRRGFPPSPPPSSRMDVSNGAGGLPPRSLSSRLTDPYVPPPLSASGDDRPYPLPASRDFDRDRARYGGEPPPSSINDHVNASHPPPFSRVRGRSPSPLPPRRGPPGIAGDDLRPPMKRAREDSGPGYTSGGDGGGSAYSPPRRGDYATGPPPASATTTGTVGTTTTGPARSTGTPPPPSTAGSSVFYDRERDQRERERERERSYVRGPADYGMGYDRDRDRGRRSPPLGGGGGRMGGPVGYGRGPIGGDRRDDRRYIPPPPRTS